MTVLLIETQFRRASVRPSCVIKLSTDFLGTPILEDQRFRLSNYFTVRKHLDWNSRHPQLNSMGTFENTVNVKFIGSVNMKKDLNE
jgi:hypothetical protein